MADGSGFSIGPALPGRNEGDARSSGGVPHRDRIIEAVLAEGATFWPDADGAAHVTLPAGAGIGPRRYRVASPDFRMVVRQVIARRHPRTLPNGKSIPGSASDTAMNEALPTLEAMALDRPKRDAGVRVCLTDGAVWLDLGRPDWSVVRVTADGWEILPGADVPLLRPSSMRPMPVPVQSADAPAVMQDLRALLNLPAGDDAALMLCVAWLVAALYPTGPFTVLALDGEQGCGKSTACRVLRRLVDPNKADLRAPSRNEDDLIIAAQQSRVVAFDNVSTMDADMADSLCRLATGSAMSKRTLFTDGQEHVVEVCRPILLNGIPSLLGRGDLADRALAITLPVIRDSDRQTEAALRTAFDDAAPVLLGALLDGLALAMRTKDAVNLPMPRMADFARLACAAAPVFGWTAEAVLAAIEHNRAEAVTAVIESDPVAVAVLELARQGYWSGTGSELLTELGRRVPEAQQRERVYPRDAARLSKCLRRFAPALRCQGVDVTLPSGGGRAGRIITIQAGPIAGQRSGADDEAGYL